MCFENTSFVSSDDDPSRTDLGVDLGTDRGVDLGVDLGVHLGVHPYNPST